VLLQCAKEMAGAAKFEIMIRGNPSDKVPLVFENKDHEQHFDKLLEMKVFPFLPALCARPCAPLPGRRPCDPPASAVCAPSLACALNPSL
jgi:hypothetical protein